jgi:hypothetical protein
MRKSLWILLAILVVAIGAPVAHADTVTFVVTGSVSDGSIISGTITIDTTVGDITAADLIFGAPASTTQINIVAQAQNGYFPNQYGAVIRNASNTIDFDFSLPDGGTLVGYAGDGSGTVGNLFNLGTNTGYDNVTAFKLTQAPEPGTLALMLSGVGSVGLMLGMRKRQRQGLHQAS